MKKGYMKALQKGWVRGFWVASVVGCVSAGFGAESLSARKPSVPKKVSLRQKCRGLANEYVKDFLGNEHRHRPHYHLQCKRHPKKTIKELKAHMNHSSNISHPPQRLKGGSGNALKKPDHLLQRPKDGWFHHEIRRPAGPHGPYIR